jgi:Flp pilus assembly pilin Flp
MQRILAFLQDDRGAAGAEFAFVAAVLVLGSVVGMLAVRAELLGQSGGIRQVMQNSLR